MLKRNVLDRRGFTLVELVTVLVILAILTAVAFPAFGWYMEKSKQDAAVLECRSCVSAAQTLYTEHYFEKDQVTNEQIAELAAADGTVLSKQYSSDALVLHLSYRNHGYTVTYCRDWESCPDHEQSYTFTEGAWEADSSQETSKEESQEEESSSEDQPQHREDGFWAGGEINDYWVDAQKADLSEKGKSYGFGTVVSIVKNGEVFYYIAREGGAHTSTWQMTDFVQIYEPDVIVPAAQAKVGDIVRGEEIGKKEGVFYVKCYEWESNHQWVALKESNKPPSH